jgi:hypothetical protein
MAITFDQASVRQMMLDKIKSLAGKDYDALQFSTLNLELDAIAFAISNLALYDEYLTRESAWDTAENYYSLRAQLKTRGYKPKRVNGATGYLIFSTNEDIVNSPTWSQVTRYEKGDMVVVYNESTLRVELYRSIHDNLFTSVVQEVVAVDVNTGRNPLDNINTYWERVDCRFLTADILVPLGTTFTGAGLSFVSTKEMTLLANEEYIVVPIKQGIRKSASLQIVGNTVGSTSFPKSSISDRNIDQEFYFITVGGQEYKEFANIYEAASSDYAFEVITDSDNENLSLVFGNGQFGVRPAVGVDGNIIYLETEGIRGEVHDVGVVNTVRDTIYYYDQNTIPISVTCYCSNPGTITGAYNGDTLEQIKSGAVTAYQSQNRAITLQDFQSLLDNHPSVGNCLVWGEYDVCKDRGQDWDEYVLTNQNKIHVCGYDQVGNSFSPDIQEELLAYLYNKKSPMDIIIFDDVESIGLIFSIHAFVTSTAYSLPEVRQQIILALTENYTAASLGFKTPLYETTWKGLISEITGVHHHTSSILLVKEVGLDGGGASNTITCQLPFETVRQGSYELWYQPTPTSGWAVAATMSETKLNWVGPFAAGANTSPSQMSALGAIEISKVTLPSGVDPEVVRFRILYDLEFNGEAILDIVPKLRNQILNYLETRNLEIEYAT